MSNVSITEVSGELYANDYTVPQGQTYVTFHSDVPCTVCFQNEATFAISSEPFTAGESKSLPIRSYETTQFTPIQPGSPCGSSPVIMSSPGVHTIVIS